MDEITTDYPYIDNQDEFQETLSKWVEAVNEFMEQVRHVLIELCKAIGIYIQKFTRALYASRLASIGIPAYLAAFIADHIPWWWLPVEWAYCTPV